MEADFFTTPKTRYVTTEDKDTWAVDMTNELGGGESVASATARLIRVFPPTSEVVAGFVVAAVAASPNVNVQWDASVLSPRQTYHLHTVGTLNTGAVVAVVTVVRCED